MNMIEQADQRLRSWVETVLGSVTVSFDPPSNKPGGEGVSLYLFELLSTPPPSSTKLSPLQFTVRYLVTTWADTPEKAHQLLSELVLAALGTPDLEVEIAPFPSESWLAIGAQPRPSFYIKTIVRQERVEPLTHLVEQPLIVETAQITSLVGELCTPDNIPIMGGYVELIDLGLSAYTDRKGRFRFPTIPSGLPLKLQVKARGKTLNVLVKRLATDTDPIVIQIDPLKP